MSVFVQLTIGVGTDRATALADAWRVACRLQVSVQAEFNGCPFVAHSYQDLAETAESFRLTWNTLNPKAYLARDEVLR